jgi:hypothetical protein
LKIKHEDPHHEKYISDTRRIRAYPVPAYDKMSGLIQEIT